MFCATQYFKATMLLPILIMCNCQIGRITIDLYINGLPGCGGAGGAGAASFCGHIGNGKPGNAVK
jgi:hypothetical protein